jgi:HK97 family phage prohead protease
MRDYMLIPGKISFKDSDPDFVFVDGVASPYGTVDQGNDRIMPGAYSEDIAAFGASRPCLWQHNTREPIGTNQLMDSLTGLMTRALLPKEDDLVKGRVMPQLKCGSIGGFSIGYECMDYSFTQENGQTIRNMKKIKLYEVSLVTMPMARDAVIFSVTKAAEHIAEFKTLGAEAKNMITGLADSLKGSNTLPPTDYLADDVPWDKTKALKDIKDHDGKDDCYVGGYPVVYWTEKGFRTVPRGVFSAGVNALEAKDAPQDIINQLYKKLGEEPIFQKDKIFISANTLKAMSKKEMEKIFDNKYTLSKSAKEFMLGLTGPGAVLQGQDVKTLISELRNERLLIDLKLYKEQSNG